MREEEECRKARRKAYLGGGNKDIEKKGMEEGVNERNGGKKECRKEGNEGKNEGRNGGRKEGRKEMKE